MAAKDMSAEKLISKAIIELQGTADKTKQTGREQPFFAHALLSMHYKPFPGWMPENERSMGVDAKGNLYYDAEWVKSLTDDERVGVLCHEVLHCLLLHHARMGGRNLDVSNIAQDMVVNHMVVKSGMSLPKQTIPVDINTDSSEITLNGEKIKINDLSEKMFEEVYYEIIDRLKMKGKQPSGGGSGGPKRFDDHIYGDGDKPQKDEKGNITGQGGQLSPQELSDLTQEMNQRLADASAYSKQQGKMPVGLQRMIDELLKPKVNWRALLLKYVSPYLQPVDWTYQKLHRKSQVLDVPLPSVLRESCEIEVIVDTSGSIGQEALTEFISEIVGMARSMRHLDMHITFVDAAVQARYKVDNGDIKKILAVEAKGGGGTQMESGLDYIKKNNPAVPVVIVLTDAFDSYSRKGRDYPFNVIWCIAPGGNQQSPPYGYVVRMDG